MFSMNPGKLAPPFQFCVRENQEKYSSRSCGVHPAIALRRL
jgi:hypothetical protein